MNRNLENVLNEAVRAVSELITEAVREGLRQDLGECPQEQTTNATDLAEFPVRLYTTDQLADFLSVSRGVIHQMSSAGELPPAIKIGRRVRYDERDVIAWLDSKKEK